MPTVRHHERIKNLETTLERQLFTRHSTGVDLTHHGKTLLRLLQEQVSAVCSPAFLADNKYLDNPHALLGKESRLLHLNTPSEKTPWLDWSKWLGMLDVPVDQIPVQIVFNSSTSITVKS